MNGTFLFEIGSIKLSFGVLVILSTMKANTVTVVTFITFMMSSKIAQVKTTSSDISSRLFYTKNVKKNTSYTV